jgi:hypothetical protein
MQTVYKAPEWTPHVPETLHTDHELDRLDRTETAGWLSLLLGLAELTLVVSGVVLVALILGLMAAL